MLDNFRYTLLWLARSPAILVWSLLFPLVLTTVFMLMFEPLDDLAEASLDPFPVVAVEPGEQPGALAFEAFMAGASSGDGALLETTWAPDAEQAEALVRASIEGDDPYVGYVALAEGDVVAYVVPGTEDLGMEDLKPTVLSLALDGYEAHAQLASELLARDPQALADPAVVASLMEPLDATEQVSLTQAQPKESVRYYFALLGMAALFCGGLGLAACQRLRPNVSALGARRAVGAVGHGQVVGATLLASWALSFACLAVAYAYMRIVAGVDFGGRDVACLLAVAVSSLTATALGCAVASIPHIPEEGKTGILTGVVCFASLFAGLYGQPTMELADAIASAAPWAAFVNPAAQVSQAFYSIMYYDGYGPLASHLAVLLAMAAVLFLVSARALRRQRYASL